MIEEPRFEGDYSERQVESARRVIVDVMQVLAQFQDCLVLIGGWVPGLAIQDSEGEEHTGSIDVDFALDSSKLSDGRYAEMLGLLVATKRYRQGDQSFQLVTDVDLSDGGAPISVDVEFLAPSEVKTKKNRPKLFEGFRVLKIKGCGVAFHSPLNITVSGKMVGGAKNSVRLQVASIPDFLVMKAFALGNRDKPKDAYDICFCLDHYELGIGDLATRWKNRKNSEPDILKAIEMLAEKFESTDSYGSQQVVEFQNSTDPETREQHARRAFELVQRFLELTHS